METRGQRILKMLLTENRNEEDLSNRFLNLPRYETTKGLGKEYRDLAIKSFQDASISSSTDKPPATISPEIPLIPRIQVTSEQLAKLQNSRAINFEGGEEVLSEPEPFSPGDSGSEYHPSNNFPSTESDRTTDKPSDVTSSTDKIVKKELVEINCAKKTFGGKRVRNKDHSCYFCHKLLRNLSKHFERAHANETEVARILSMPKYSKRRREAFNALTRNGDFYHNCEVLLLQKGELILTRRPTEQEKSS
nr:unnamed protein product [Callosobruchus analis]